MPGLECKFTENININLKKLNKKQLNNFFGFFYCEIITNDNDYLGLIPTRSDLSIIMPSGCIKGWYFSEELKYALSKGYDIEVKYGYTFNKVHKVFDKYINEFYGIKSRSANPAMKVIAKSLLNNLLGRFGLDINKMITRLLSYDEYLYILQTREIRNVKYIKDKVLLTYSKDISYEISTIVTT